MKTLRLVAFVLAIFTVRVSGQDLNKQLRSSYIIEESGIPINEMAKYIGKDVYVRDTISGYKLINDTLKLLYLGGKYPKQKLTIIFQKNIVNVLELYLNNIGRFSGKVIIYESKPAIVVTSADQLLKHIQI